jgi:hypothetical protein
MILITGTENPGPSMSALWHSWSAETAEPAPSTSYLFFTWCDSALMEKWGLYLFFFFFFAHVFSLSWVHVDHSYTVHMRGNWHGHVIVDHSCGYEATLRTLYPLALLIDAPYILNGKGSCWFFFIHSKSLACVINKHNKCLFSKIWGFFCNFYTLMIIKASSN